ncbi:nigrin b-like [Cucumis melo var. makuwa]|uniref:Nigrin b-like n=1 Tax=Cucumis melo var. makuwa TaxID=1194695 RepID=A0A5A7T854_CUCMM|nr:nigrin b-like [Cucumis melo var. makuwa]
MKEIVLSIIVAFSLTTHLAMAVPSNYGYGGEYGGVPGATHLVGRDGLCLEMSPWFYRGNNFPTRLSPCDEHKKQTQLWTVVGDGTIRPMNDKFCLVADVLVGVINKAVVRECAKESNSNKRWTHKKDGTITHVESGMVLTGDSDYVTLQSNKNTPSQSWEATESSTPMIANIEWLNNLCLQSTDDSNHVGLNGCNRENKDQRWALYGDGTIRQNVNRNYCLTSDEYLGRFIVMSKCEDKPQQRWNLGAKDSTIDHPNTDMVMDVLFVPYYDFSSAVVTNRRDGSASQRWTIN